jgi:hypothetical protein
MFNKLTTLLIALLFSLSCFAGEGMWLPHLLKALNEAEMKSMGMKMSAEDIYSVNNGSLKDAIAHFGGGCTSSIISANGLLLTNHHCGYRQIQNHSSVENNLLRNGFWANNYKEELPNPGLFVTFIDRIEDVSEIALAGVENALSAAQRQSIIDKNINAYRQKNPVKDFQNIIIRPFFEGNQYFAFYTTTFNDVRLVGTPPESIGKYGADTDNWEWPRHTGDFALFRVYAGPNNEPAEYSESNKPYTPKHFLPVSLDGVDEGDFTLIFGFPGRTEQYLPGVAVKQIIEEINPARIKVRDASLAVMDKYMRADEATKIQYASKFASIANAWKKWKGENLGLLRTNALQRKADFEKEFSNRSIGYPHYYRLLAEFESVYATTDELAMVQNYYAEVAQRNVDVFRIIFNVRRLVNIYDVNGEAAYNDFKNRLQGPLLGVYNGMNSRVDKGMAARLMQIYMDNVPAAYHPSLNEEQLQMIQNKGMEAWVADLYANSIFSNSERFQQAMENPASDAVALIKSDGLFSFFSDWAEIMAEKVERPYSEKLAVIDSLQTVYMTAQMELFPEKRFYPDANSTLRVTYGNVEGYLPRDAVKYQPFTYLEGVLEKYIPGDYEFDLPDRLIELINTKDYGQYADESGSVPVCFLGSNHTTGGNSGSPAIDAYGNLIGLNFDRVWEGTMSDINYDRSICRNIMVDARYMLFVIDKFAGAQHLIEEMKLVRPKS